MIVFNVFAIVVGLIIGVFVGPLYWLFPDFMDTTWGNVVACSIMALVGLVTDFLGLKGRLFWLPIWLWGLLGVGYNFHTLWGWAGIGAGAGIIVLLFVGLGVLAAINDRRGWAEAPANLNSARDAFARAPSDEAWELLGKAYFSPAWMTETAEHHRHNLEVMAVARKAMGEKAGPLEVRVFDALGIAYREAMTQVEGGEKKSVPSELTSAMQEIIEHKGALPEGEHEDLVEALDKPAPAES